jgi:hypothetical protein
VASFKFPKKLPKAWIEAIERNAKVGSIVHGMKVIGRDKRGTIIHIGKDAFKILHNGKNQSIFGNQAEESTQNPFLNKIQGSWFTCPESGTGESISVFLRCYSSSYYGNVKCAIYKKSDNSLVGTTEEKYINWTTAAWETFNFNTPKPNLENIDYYLVAWTGTNYLYMYYVTETAKGVQDLETYDGFPNPLVPSLQNRKFSIYCTYTTGGEIYEINVDAVVKASAEKSLQTTYNIEKDAAVSSQAVRASETTFNIPKDAIVKSLADLGIETTFSISKDALVQALADVVVEKVAGQLIEIFKDAVVQAQATFSLESIFNINKDAVAEVTATFDMETIFNVVKDAIVKASTSPQVVGVYPINLDAVVKASATPSLQQTLGISKDAVVVAVSTPLIQSTFNISKDAVVKVLAEVTVVKEGEVKVTKLFLMLGNIAIQLTGN